MGIKDKKGGTADSEVKDKKTPKTPKDKKSPGKETPTGIKQEGRASITPNAKPVALGRTPQSTVAKPRRQSLSARSKEEEAPRASANTNTSQQSGKIFKKSTSVKFLGIPLEWNSQTIKEADLSTDGFSCCVVLVAEESADLTEYTDFLYQAINTGVRKRFIALKGEEIAAKVFQFMTTSQMREPGEDEDSHLGRMDLWAEAIKFCLLQCKHTVDNEATFKNIKENDSLGARSKDVLQRLSPISPPLKSGVKDADEDAQDAEAAENKKATAETLTKKSIKDKKEKIVINISTGETTKDPDRESAVYTGSMKKRGEISMPFLEQIDDVPINGSKLYIILQGFYNPRLLPELKKIGVPVNGILLVTNNKQEKKNFSIYDIEENIAGTFIPRNVLPDYVNIIQRRHSYAFKSQPNAVITQFWMELAALINNAPAQSCLHDIALLNCPLPKPEIGLDTPEGQGIFATQIFDEAAQRIYEMHVLLDWFQEYKHAVHVRQITPIEAEIPHILYERLVRQVPAECVTVPIIMECMVEQAMENVGVDNDLKVQTPENPKVATFANDLKINIGPGWGLTALPNGKEGPESRSSFAEGSTSSKKNLLKPTFLKPMFIRNGDYASMRTAHLTENIGSRLASSQVTGDFHRLESILWQDLPEFNKGLYMKLLGNLNHFMYFLPPDAIRLDDMFFILHLLMTAGVETHLQKLAEEKEKARAAAAKKPSLPAPLSLLINTHGPGADVHYIQGTKLLSDHNYLTIDEEDALHFILAPTGSENEMTVSELGQTKHFRQDSPESLYSDVIEDEYYDEEDNEFDGEEDEGIVGEKRRKTENMEEGEGHERVSRDETKSGKKNSLEDAASGDGRRVSDESTGENRKKSQSEENRKKSQSEENRNTSHRENDRKKLSNVSGLEGEFEEEEGEDIAEHKHAVEESETPPATAEVQQAQQFGVFGSSENKSKKFISCDGDFYKELNDFSTFKSLLECPALLTIGNNGALDLSKWVETYLDSKGLHTAAGEGMMIGQLKDWNFVEEYLPVQMIQVLSEAIGDYLSLQRMYCPFYDTILFIFNNPTPYSLQSDSNFVSKIHTLPGLQHFLEYTINDEEVLHWIMQLEQKKGVEVVDSFSADTLMKIVPDDQWILAPSIKEKIMKRKNAQERKAEELERIRLEKNYSHKLNIARKKLEQIESTTKGKKKEDVQNDDKKKKNKKSVVDGKNKNSKTDDKKEKDKKEGKGAPDDTKKDTKEISDDKDGTKKPTEDEDSANIDTGKEKSKSKNRKPSFNFADALRDSKGIKKHPRQERKTKLFHCYDLGKRIIITAVDTYHMFPLDGSIIQYEIATIEPEYRMMQLSITKNGHQSYFYPYYIPHDLDLSTESYVVIPYFHMVHSNGTIFAFQDQRAKEAAPYIRYCLKTKTHTKKFTYDKVVFADELGEQKKPEHRKKARHLSSQEQASLGLTEPLQEELTKPPEEESVPTDIQDADIAVREADDDIDGEPEQHPTAEEKTESKLKIDEEDSKKNLDAKKSKKDKKKDEGKGKEKKKGKDKDKGPKVSASHMKHDKDAKGHHSDTGPSKEHEIEQEIEHEHHHHPHAIVDFQEDLTGEWIYPASEESDEEDVSKRKRSLYAHTWDEAVKILSPLVHSFKVTFPSGLVIQVSDAHGPPLNREIKQWYADKGSSTSLIESSRYYTSNGSVVKFMMNSTIQVINARGVTTSIREVSANVNREKNNIRRIFTKATAVKVFEGDVILPTGEYWKISKGSKFYHNPLFLFSGGQLPGGETFRRRQDGVIYLHRHDGTVICHYPDGTRFTTRMIILKDPVEEFEDWVFVGMKTMIEHPNYATVLFNTLSGNVHLKLPQGEWVRIFADGGIKVGTVDEYTLDVDRNRALLSYPSCAAGNCGDKKIPNVTAVKLFHNSIIPETVTIPAEVSKEALATTPENEPDPDVRLSIPSTISIDSHDKGKSSKSTIENTHSRKGSNRSEYHDSDEQINRRNTNSFDEGNENDEIIEENDRNLRSSQGNETVMDRKRKLNEDQTKSDEIRLEVEDFLQFTDTWTFCKSIDSWDNRFAITVFGDKTVNKSDRFQKEMCVSTESLLNTFKQPLSHSFLPGILPSTSSENLIKLSKRITAFRQGKIGDCGKLQKTKIFVVKRDLSGYQFLKQQEVDSVLQKVRCNRESVIVTDSLPNVPPRKFITIMEPISTSEKPNGMWQTAYREPMFRPRILNNKQLRIARPEDLRWFGYVLSTAQMRRPSFYKDPKTRFLARKASLASKSPESSHPGSSHPESLHPESSHLHSKTADRKTKSHEMAEAKTEGSKGHAHHSKNETHHAEAKAEDPTEHVDANSSEGMGEDKSKNKDVARKSKDSKKDKKKKKELVKAKSSKDRKLSTDSTSEEKKDNDENKVDATTAKEDHTENKPQPPQVKYESTYFGNEKSLGEYPEDVLDVDGIYNIDDSEKPKITNKEHAELCTRHKAIVVRNFMEIPQIDETLQSTLISASMCYGKTVHDQMGIYKTYEMDDDKFEDERKRQMFIKQQLIEQNLEDMHLYEQSQGKVLSFHF